MADEHSQQDRKTWRFSRFLTREIGLRLLALVVAVGLWMFVNAGQRSAQVTFAVPVSYRSLPAGMVIVNRPPDFVRVEIAGPRTLLSLLNAARLTLNLDLAGVSTGKSEFKISPGMFNVPRQTAVTRISPSQISLDIDRIVTREVPVHLLLRGAPAPGYTVSSISLDPSKVMVNGPSRYVDPLKQADTGPFDIGGATGDIERAVAVDQPNRLVHLAAAEVKATVAIAEVIEDREFHGVEVEVRGSKYRYLLRQSRADLTLRGPMLKLAAFDPKGSVFIDATGVKPGWHELPVKVSLPDGLALVRQEPEKVKLRTYHQRLKTTPDGKKPKTVRH